MGLTYLPNSPHHLPPPPAWRGGHRALVGEVAPAGCQPFFSGKLGRRSPDLMGFSLGQRILISPCLFPKHSSRFSTFDPEPSYHTRDLAGGAGGDGGRVRWGWVRWGRGEELAPSPLHGNLMTLEPRDRPLPSLASLMRIISRFHSHSSRPFQGHYLLQVPPWILWPVMLGPGWAGISPGRGREVSSLTQLSLQHQCVSSGS